MIKNKIVIFLILIGLLSSLSAQENVKIAQTGFQFLSVLSDARGAALAGAVTSLDMKSSSLFFNPACMADVDGFLDVSASLNSFIADIKHNTFSLAFSPFDGQYGVIGASVQTVDYGDNFIGTIATPYGVDDYMDTGELKPTATSIGLGYAKAINDKFSVGGQVRWVEQDMGEVWTAETLGDTATAIIKEKYSLSPFAFDFGTLYKTGFKSLVFGMSIRNFSTDVKYVKESFQLPLVFTIGIHMDMMDFVDESQEMHSAVLAVNSSHYRSRPEDVQIALEYTVMQILSFRGGYVSQKDLEGISYGAGISYQGLTFDYSYTPFSVFDDVTRVTIRFSY